MFVNSGGSQLNNRQRILVTCAVVAAVATSSFVFTTEVTHSAQNAGTNVTSTNGLTTVTFNTDGGKIHVYLPDDIAAGDRISGTLGVDRSESNRNALNGFSMDIAGHKLPLFNGPCPAEGCPPVSFILKVDANIAGLPIVLTNNEGTEAGRGLLPVFVASTPVIPKHSSGAVITSGGPPANNFVFPAIGQQGRPVQIFGPFDGDTGNTMIQIQPCNPPADFEKRSESVRGGFGVIRPLAESPRKLIFHAPINFAGSSNLNLKEAGIERAGPYRNVAVKLSAPKTNLVRGERTVVTVEVRGLEGIQNDVPLQLDSRGVITMDGGNFQNLLIAPSEVSSTGIYTTSRPITGQAAGGFNVTATVIVNRFDMCLSDNAVPSRRILWNTFTGDYQFFNFGPSSTTTGQKPEVKSTTSGVNLTGLGKPTMKGCIITLSHNAPDRRIFARLDVCTNTGDSSVQTNSPGETYTITDNNTKDNSCSP